MLHRSHANRLARGAGRRGSGSGGDDVLGELEQAYDVHEALAALPENCQEILDRFFARDESYRTIGDALELPAGTIASRISRCLTKLRENWEETEYPARPENR